MIANYHSHTWRCNHASGTEQEYLEAARKRGFVEFGFSDHTPYPFPWYHLSWFRMKCDELREYTNTVDMLRKAYPDMRIHTGLEAEYYPAYFKNLMALLRDSDVQYLLLGQHYLDNEIGAHYSGNATADEALLRRYCTQTRDAMQTGLFTYFAHPDLIHFKGSGETYIREMRGLCREAKSCGMPLEVNLLGIEKGRHYPDIRFWRIAAEENCPVILGCDTHDPKALGSEASEIAARRMVSELGLLLMDKVELRPIR